MKKRYTEEQIIRTIKEREAGAKVDDLCRQFGISSGPHNSLNYLIPVVFAQQTA